MKLFRRIAIAAGILILLFLLAVVIIHMPSVQMAIWSKIQNYLQSEYNVRVETERLKFSLLSGLQAELSKVKVYGGPQNEQQFAVADKVRIYAPLSILWASDKIVEKVQIENPDVNMDYTPRPKPQPEAEDSGKFEIKAIEIIGAKAAFSKYHFDELHLSSAIENNALIIRKLTAKAYGSTIDANGTITNFANPTYDLNFSVNGDAAIVKVFSDEAPAFSGPVVASGKITGAKTDVVIDGKLNSTSLRLNQSTPFQAQAQYKINMADSVRPYDIKLQWSHFPVSELQKFSPSLPAIASLSEGSLQYIGGTDPFAAQGTIITKLTPLSSGALPVKGTVQGNLANGSLNLQESNLAFRSTAATLSGKIYRNSLDLTLRANIGTMSDLAVFSPDLRKVPGSYRVNATVKGQFEDLTLQGRVNGTGAGMSMQADGSFRTGPEVIDATVHGKFEGSALNRFGVTDLNGSFQVDGTIVGAVTNPKLQGTLQGNDVLYQSVKLGTLDAGFNSDGRTLSVNAEIPDLKSTVNASYVWKSRNFELDAATKDLNTEEIRALLPASANQIKGTISAKLHAYGNASRWKSADGELTIESAKLQWNEFPIELESESIARMDDGVVTASIRSKVGSGDVALNGTYRLVDNHFTVDGNLNDINVDDIRPLSPEIPADLSGTFTASIKASGNAKQWKDSDAEIHIQKAAFNKAGTEIKIAENSSLILHDRMLNADVNMTLPKGQFLVQGKLPIEGTAGADLYISGRADLSMVSMLTQQFEVSGIADLDLQVKGNLKKPIITGDLKTQNLIATMPARQLTLRADLLNAHFSGEEIQISLNGMLNDSGIKVEGIVPLVENRSGSIKANIDPFPLQTLAPDSKLSGTVSLAVDAKGTGIKPEFWTGNVEVKLQDVRVNETPVESDQTLKIHLAQQRITIEPFQLKAADTLNLSVNGYADLKTQTLQADVKTDFDLLFLRSFINDFNGSGKVIAEIKATGSLKDPQMSGLISLSDGFMRVPGYPIIVEGIQLRAPFDMNRVRIEKLTAAVGGGPVEGSGGFDIKNFQLVNVNISLTGRNVGLRYPGDLRSLLNADVKLTSEKENFLVSGNVDIVRSVYREDIDYRDRLVNSLLFHREALATSTNMQSRLRLDLNVKTIDDFRMDNNLARVRALANLQLQGTTSEPRILGRVQIRDGSVLYFQGNDFVVERGNIDFYGARKLNPVFDIVLVALIDNRTPPEPFQTVDQYEVEVRVSGTLDNLEDTTVSSYPRLEEQQIYSLILTGGTNSSLSQAGSKVFQQELAAYFAGQIFFGAPAKLADVLGLTRVDIQPDFVSPDEDPTARLVVGKDITAHLGLVYSVSLSNSEDQTWLINYRLSRNFSLRYVDDSDEPNTWGLRHSLRFGPGESALRTRKQASRLELEPIDKVILENEVPLSDDAVFKKVDELEGMRYDYWRVYDEILDLKSFLQDNGYLFPDVSVEESRTKDKKLQLKLRVSGRGKRTMVFDGYDPGGREKTYREWWREGFSEQAVLEQIREDLLEELWKKGYLKAEVEVKKEGSEQDTIRHIFKITTGSAYKEVELKFEGAKSYNTQKLEEDLKNLYGSREEMVIDAFHRFPTFAERVEALYIQNGFLDAKAEDGASLFREDGTAQREIIINENQPARVEDVEVTDHNGFPPDLVARLKALPGRIYTPSLLSEDLITATEYYENHGYPNVDISSDVVRRAGDPRLLIRYNLNPGNQIRIGSIRILGNYSTRRAVIERRLTFREGDLLVKSQLYQSQRLLYKTHVFQQVRIEPEESDQSNIYNVNVEVTESKKYRFTYGVRYDSESNVGGDFILEDTRLFGTAHSLSFFTRANSIEQTAGFTYTMPSIWGVTRTGSAYPTGWDLLIQLRWEREDLDTFVSQRDILDVQKQFRLIGPFIIVGEYSYERVDSRGEFFDATRSISSLSGTVIADTRDEPINAHRGYFISLENTFAPSALKGDVLFKRFYYQFFYFRPFGKIVWANGFRIGLAYPEDQRLLEDERFRAGGASTVRGFKLNELGPRDIFGDPAFGESLMIFNEEVRFPVYKWIGGVAFYDAGNVYNKASDLSFSDIRHSVGAGIRLNTPFGVGRFDVGFNLDPQFDEPSRVYHFGFGQAF